MSATIRAMTREDIPVVLEMLGSLNATGHQADPRYALVDDWREPTRRMVLDQWFGVFQPFPPAWLAEIDGRVVGFVQGDVVATPPILVRPPSTRIGNLWVEPEHRRHGIATELVTRYITESRANGFPWVEVGTLTKDTRAVGFWRSMGFDDWRVALLSEP